MIKVSGFTINLFRVKANRLSVEVGYINLQDNFKINATIHNLEHKYKCIAGPQYSSYRGLEPGVYFVCNEYEILTSDNIEYSFKAVNSSSYVMKYLVLKAIVRKVQELGSEGKLFLPRNWFAYSQITCCESEALEYSEPYKLFALRPCLILRVEHLLVRDEDRLYLLADLKLKRFNSLTLSNIVKILMEKGYDIPRVNELLRAHYYTCIDKENKVSCRVNKVEDDKVEVIIGNERRSLSANDVVLNPHPKHTRDFIEKELSEKISEVEELQRDLGRQRPKHKIDSIKNYVEKLLKETGVFPIRLSNVEYTLELSPQIIFPRGGKVR